MRERKETVLYHGAAVGRKVTCRRLGYAGFEFDRYRTVTKDTACDFSMRHQSVVGEGEITELIDEKEKTEGLQVIMKQITGRADWEFKESVLAKTCVFRLEVKEISAREHS